jgi:homoserine kinase
MVAAFYSENWEILRIASKDRFHQRQRMKMLPELFTVQKLAYENGALMSTLSGSGSTFFSMCYDEDAERIHTKMEQRFPDFTIKTLDFDNQGLKIER